MKVYIQRMRATGKCPPRNPFHRIFWSWVGSFLGILVLGLYGQSLPFSHYDQLFLIGSFGASAVLIYGVPAADFSQPRNLIGGHVVSALVGVSIALLIPDYIALSSALAVSLSIVAMHLTRTLHPPGGATALIAVIGSDQIQGMGYYFVLSPVLVGVTVILLVALAVNNLSSNPQSHYPKYWL